MRTLRLAPLLLAALAIFPTACADNAQDDADTAEDAVSDGVLRGIGQKLEGASNAEVLGRNEDAFAAKVAVVDSARPGDTLDVSYYIFADDESSAFYATRLVEAAKRGVKVRVMLDHLTNFSRYHYFKALQDAAGGSDRLEFRFYNKPSPAIVEDVKFLVTPCPLAGKDITSPECTAKRRELAAKQDVPAWSNDGAAPENRAALFLTGLYAKSGTALQVSAGEVIGQYQALPTSSNSSDAARAIEGLKLLFNAKIKGEVGASLLVALAGDQLQPLHNLWASVIPAAADEHAEDWEHLTDFNHQKLTLRTSANGSGEVVLGGRNLENSYHLTNMPAGWDGKYVFMDMDFRASFSNAERIRARFDKIWNFTGPSGMVATMGRDLEQLTSPYLKVGGKPILATYTYADIQAKAQRFAALQPQAGDTDLFPRIPVDLAADRGASFYYLENVHNPQGARVFGTNGKWGKDVEAGKEIQELWVRSLRDLCRKGKGNGQKAEIVMHNAYVSMPSLLEYELFERARLRTNGTAFECENGVSKVRIITNSRESTDLNIVNVYNEAWMKPLLENDRNLPAHGGHFVDYREYKPSGRSLHAKVMIFGDDVFIGSANADGRSLMMDANNGVFIRNAPNLAKRYRDWLTNTIEPQLLTGDDPRQLRRKGNMRAIAEDNARFLNSGKLAQNHPALAARAATRVVNDSMKLYAEADRCLPAKDVSCLLGIDRLLQPF